VVTLWLLSEHRCRADAKRQEEQRSAGVNLL
jgi:hypothetical protein